MLHVPEPKYAACESERFVHFLIAILLLVVVVCVILVGVGRAIRVTCVPSACVSNTPTETVRDSTSGQNCGTFSPSYLLLLLLQCNRLLALGPASISLLDSKTRMLAKTQSTSDLMQVNNNRSDGC
jgi:hypothetical protein